MILFLCWFAVWKFQVSDCGCALATVYRVAKSWTQLKQLCTHARIDSEKGTRWTTAAPSEDGFLGHLRSLACHWMLRPRDVPTHLLWLLVWDPERYTPFFFGSSGFLVVAYGFLVQHVGSSSLTRDWTLTPALGAWSPSHWTTREVPRYKFLTRM